MANNNMEDGMAEGELAQSGEEGRMNPDEFVKSIDWRGSWIESQNHRGKTDDPTKWDARADQFAQRKRSSYSETFVKYLDLEPGETVFDMGCGTGEISLQIAEAGHDVISADFSKRMLGYVKKDIEQSGLDNVRVVNMAWGDDWEKFGIVENCVDVAVASRSIMVPDLWKTLERLSSVARHKVAVSLATGSTPADDFKLLEAVGRHPVNTHDDIYCVNMVYQMGYLPEVRYIKSDKKYEFSTLDDAFHDLTKRIPNITPEEESITRDFLKEHVVESVDEKGNQIFKFDYSRASDWAYISWRTDSR
ncbi:MAG: class I SAM-dependent methyltransferase [Coriobacteriales bacterium]